MGYWGTGILENDNAGDYLCSYFDLYDEGKEHKEIRTELEEAFLKNDNYEDWLYLAYCQWKCGFLEEDVLEKVEEIIKTGIDRQSWIDGAATEKDIKQREKKLNKFFEKLHTQNPKPVKRKRKIFKDYPNKYNVGDCFTFQVGDKFGGILIYEVSNPLSQYPETTSYYRVVNFNILKDEKLKDIDFQDASFVNIDSVTCYFMREFEKDERFEWITNQNMIIEGISSIFFTFRRTDNIIEIAKSIDGTPSVF